MKSPIFATLTMPHTRKTTRPEDVRTMRRAFGKWRNRKWFKERVKGGIGSVEITCGENGWHPHVHMLVEARWLAVTTPSPDRSYSPDERKEMQEASQRELLWQWQACLKISRGGGIWVKRADEKTAVEVLKYSVKPADLANAEFPLAPLLRVLTVSRLITSWGTVRKEAARLAAIEKEDRAPLMCPCGCSDWIPEILTPKATAEKHFQQEKARVEQLARECDGARKARHAEINRRALETALGNPWLVPAGRVAGLARSGAVKTA